MKITIRSLDSPLFVVAACILAAAATTVLAAVPQTINYQGRLTTNDTPPVPVTASLPMEFRIWDSSIGGTELWTEAWGTVPVNEGLFNLILGSGVPIPLAVFLPGDTRWLELEVDGEILQPRQQLSSVGWAFLADKAEGSDALGGVAASGWQKRILGSCPPGSSVQSVDDLGNVVCEIDDTGSGVPAGAVMYFNLLFCPPGWSELTLARGRYLVGLPLGGTLLGFPPGTTALGNLENRPVGQHGHTITDPGHAHAINDPGHSHTYTPPISLSTSSGASAAKVGSPTQTSTDTTGITILTATTGITANSTGTAAGTNAPYIQLLVCQKN